MGAWLVRVAAGAHQDQGALGEWRIYEERGAGQGHAIVNVVQEQEGRKRPQLIEGKESRPDFQEIGAGAGGIKKCRGENESADGNQDSGGHDQDVQRQSGFGQRREEVFDLSQISQCTDVEGHVHQLQQNEKRLHDAMGGLRKLVW